MAAQVAKAFEQERTHNLLGGARLGGGLEDDLVARRWDGRHGAHAAVTADTWWV